MNKTGIRKGRPGFYVEFNEWHGKRRKHCTRNFLTLPAAREFVRRFNAKVDLRLLGETPPEPLLDATVEFKRQRGHLSASTRNDDRLFLGFLVAKSEHEMVADVTAADVDAVLQDRARKASAITAAKARSTIRTFFNWAIGMGYTKVNPVKGTRTRVRSKARRLRPAINDADLARLIPHIASEDCRVALWLTATTGMDRQVIATLRASNFDLSQGIVRFRRSKTSEVNVAPLHPSLVPLIRRRVESCPRESPLLRVPKQQDRPSDWWKMATKAAGLEGVLFRDFRALAVSRLMSAGVSLSDASKLLGHASIETTQAHYTIPARDLSRSVQQLPLPGFPEDSKSTAG